MENIFSVSKPFLAIAQTLGLFPMAFDGAARKGLLIINRYSVAVSILWFLILLCAMKITFNFDSYFIDNSKVLPKALKLLTNLNISSFLVHNSYQIYKRQNILNFLSTLYESDEKVKKCFVIS